MEYLYHIMLVATVLLCLEIKSTNSRTSTLWKLNSDQTKIIEASPFHQVVSYSNGDPKFVTSEDDPIFNIITSTVHLGESWVKEQVENYCTSCQVIRNDHRDKSNGTTINQNNTSLKLTQQDEVLDCGKPVNFTYYDNLVGVLNRNRHPSIPEPQAVLNFMKKSKKHLIEEFDVDALEQKLKKAKKEKPKSVQLYNQIGNFWRIKGDAEKSIECFRRALAVSPHNAEVLLNLARVLFTLQYLDDAIYLTRRSLEVQPPDKGAWQQYFTLGEILKAYGHYQEASMHLKHTLELKPGYEPAQIALKEIEVTPEGNVHVYTLIIIICLVLGVLLVILSSVDNMAENEFAEAKPQRHFNKAMAMRSLRGLGMGQKHQRKKIGA